MAWAAQETTAGSVEEMAARKCVAKRVILVPRFSSYSISMSSSASVQQYVNRITSVPIAWTPASLSMLLGLFTSSKISRFSSLRSFVKVSPCSSRACSATCIVLISAALKNPLRERLAPSQPAAGDLHF